MATHPAPNTHPPEQQPPDPSETREFLAQLLNSVQQSIVAINREERITYWNEHATRAYGYTREEAIGQKLGDIAAFGNVAVSRPIMDSVWSGEAWTGELPPAHRDGSSIPARVSLLPIFDSGRNVTGIAGVSRDDAVDTTEDCFQLVFEQSPLGIILIDQTGRILQSNGAYRRMLGYSAEELLGRSIIDLTHPDDQPTYAQLTAGLFAPEPALVRVEKRYFHRDGAIVWVAVTATGLPSRDGSPKLGLALIEDVTQQRRVRDELSASNVRADDAMNAKMRFLTQISHEIRSPVNGVLGMLDLLDSSHLQPEQRDNLTAARQSATSLLDMLEEILDLTRLDQHRLALHPRPYAPAQLIHDLSTLYRIKAASKNIALKASLSPGIPEQHIADPARIRQILVNLLENAIKFTTHGHVAVTVSASETALRFSVEDTGIGIASEGIDSVFEPFSALSATTSASVGGTGLGLAISQRLARLMGGDITVSSGLGEGSRFTLALPLVYGAVPVDAPSAPIPAPAAFPGRRILVVEDNLINQRVAAGILRRLSCEVDLAANGVEALTKALAYSYDAILMDAMMPVMDGFEATAELRRREPAGRHVPVIGLTALATEDDRLRCLAAGMDDYLPKPADYFALGAVLERWLPPPAAHRH